MKKKSHKYYFLIYAVSVLLLAGCGVKHSISGNFVYKTECMGPELDGSITVKAWGNGRNRSDAIEQAKKNAVYDVLFKGITEGKSECLCSPLLPEANVLTKHEIYFNTFFKDGGEYKKYISMQDTRYGDKDIKEARNSVTYGFIVRILRADLRKKLTSDGILKQ